jgi:predicted  nucleic acid-binding Zn-ribbon protein
MNVKAPWMEELEQRVRQASEEIARLRKENRRLQKLAAAGGGTPGDEEHWHQEREEVRRRVEGLASQLADLLGEDL